MDRLYRARGHREGECPVSESVSARALALPFFGALTQEQVGALTTVQAGALTSQQAIGLNSAQVSSLTTADLVKMTTAAVSAIRDTAIVGLQYAPKYARDEHYFAIREALRRVAAAKDVLYVRRYDAMMFIAKAAGRPEMMADDGFHLNDTGYQCMAEHVARGVIASLYLRRRDLPKPGAPAER